MLKFWELTRFKYANDEAQESQSTNRKQQSYTVTTTTQQLRFGFITNKQKK